MSRVVCGIINTWSLLLEFDSRSDFFRSLVVNDCVQKEESICLGSQGLVGPGTVCMLEV